MAVAAHERVEQDTLRQAPHRLVELSTTAKFSFAPETLADIQLTGLRARFRDLIGTSRKYAVPLLEWFDAAGITIRNGDVRTLRAG